MRILPHQVTWNVLEGLLGTEQQANTCIYIYIYISIYIYIYISLYNWGSKGQSTNGGKGTESGTNAFLSHLRGSGHELMHAEGYLERLASTKHVSDLKKIIRGSFSLILLTCVNVSA